MPDDAHQTSAQIPTNIRLLLILEEVTRRGVAVRPSELADAIGLPKPTIHRLLQTAESEGFLQRGLDGRSYGPGPRLRRLAVNTMSSEHLRTARLAILKHAAETIGETCNLATPDREGMTYLDRVETKWPLRIQLPIGTQVPFSCTASGKMYLSTLQSRMLNGFLAANALQANTERSIIDPDRLRDALSAIRSQGYSTDDEEFMTGMAAIAVPVLDPQGRLLATISTHAPVQRHSIESLIACLPVLQKAALDLAKL